MKFSTEFDKKCQNVYTISMLQDDGIPIEPISFRTTWQNVNRFRIIPKKTPNRNTEMKIEWPTLYLGLSRLYPIGESEEASTYDSQLSEKQKREFFSVHKDILSLNETPIDCSAIAIKETAKKKTIGIRTEKYDPICNSSGQDNLNQILLAVMSFELLKEKSGSSWKGGLLLIDELDATLHPAAQNKLVKFLFDSAKELDIQIVFTTHSLSMLNYLCQRCEHNIENGMNNIEIAYLTTRNGLLQRLPNPDYDTIYFDMLNTLSILPNEYRKIAVYMEDNEARWFLGKLTSKYMPRLTLPEINIGHDQLKLMAIG